MLGHNFQIKISVISVHPRDDKLGSENLPIIFLKSGNYFNLVSYCVSRKLISPSHLNMLTS